MHESDRQLQDMAKRVAMQVEAEKANAKPAEKEDAITPDFVSRCAAFGEKGDGLLHSAIFRNRLTYVPESKTWYIWDDHHWRTTHVHQVEASVERVGDTYREVAAHYEQLAKDAAEGGDNERANHLRGKAEQLQKRASWLNSSRGVNACVKFTLANSQPLISTPDVWDIDPWLLGVANGVVDLRTGEHRPGRPDDYILRYCPVEWKGLREPAPLWEKTLRQIIGASEGVLPWLHRVLGYAITGQSTEPLFLMLYGERGRNGKTVLMETLKKVLGPYMGPVPAELLLDRKIPKDPDAATPTIMNMKGMRIIWASETNENRRFSTAQVKLLSGSDSLTGRYLWDKQNTEFRPTHTLFLLTNFLPAAPAHDLPFWERLKLINFPYRFVDQPKGELELPRNPHLERELEAEFPGILAWLVRGCLLYRAEGLLAPPAVTKATEQYRVDEDEMQVFVDQCLEDSLAADDRINATELYEVFKEWYKKYINPKYIPSIHIFGRQISAKIEKRKVGGHTYYYGKQLSEFGEQLRK